MSGTLNNFSAKKIAENGGKVPFSTFTAKPRRIKHRGKRADRLQDAMDAAYVIAWDRSGGVCQNCGGIATQVHHLRTRPAATHLREDAANLATLCSECHDRWQPEGARFRQRFARDWPYFRAVYTCRALDELKVGRLIGDVYVPFSECEAAGTDVEGEEGGDA